MKENIDKEACPLCPHRKHTGKKFCGIVERDVKGVTRKCYCDYIPEKAVKTR